MLDFVKGECFEPHLDDKAPVRLNDRDAIELIRSTSGFVNPQDLCRLDKTHLNATVNKCLRSGIAIRQLSRITGISKYRIEYIKSQG